MKPLLLPAPQPAYRKVTEIKPLPREYTGLAMPMAQWRLPAVVRSDVLPVSTIAGAYIVRNEDGHREAVVFTGSEYFRKGGEAGLVSYAEPVEIIRRARMYELDRSQRMTYGNLVISHHPGYYRRGEVAAVLRGMASSVVPFGSPEVDRRGQHEDIRATLSARRASRAIGQLAGRLLAGDHSVSMEDLLDDYNSFARRYAYRTARRVWVGLESAGVLDTGDHDCCLCDRCGEAHDQYYFGIRDYQGNPVCGDCSDEYHIPADVGGDSYYHESNLYWWHSDDEWRTYEEPEEDEDEYSEGSSSGIYGYSERATSHLSADTEILARVSQWSQPLMGVELEVEVDARSKNDAARDTAEQFEGHAILKSDGSLTNGFEIVTAPRGLAEHVMMFGNWEPHHDIADMDSVTTAGLHVHLSSQSFSRLTLGKYLHFICSSANAPLIGDIAGRHWSSDHQAQHYASGSRQSEEGANCARLVAIQTTVDRYRAVNMCNLGRSEGQRLLGKDGNGRYNTVELRIFRAVLDRTHMLAQIEFASAALSFVRVTSMNDLTTDAFRSWLVGNSVSFPNLASFLGLRCKKQRPDSIPAGVSRNKTKADKKAKAKAALAA